jgi:hypothetical protein
MGNNETKNILNTNSSINNLNTTINMNKIYNKKSKSFKEKKQKEIYNKIRKKSFTETIYLEQEESGKDNKKKSKEKNTFRNTHTKSNLCDNNNNTNNNKFRNTLKCGSSDKKINYNNYCNSLCNKSKNRYSNKISLNRIKMYKFNKCQNLPKNITNQITNKNDAKVKTKIRYSLNLNTNKNSKKKNFTFKKSKKLTKENEQNLKEMYLKAGKAQKEITKEVKKDDNNINNNNEKNSNNLYININSENNMNKIYSYNNIFYRNNQYKNNISNSNNNTTITNNITNLSMSPIILSGLPNYENLSMDEKLNLSENRNNNINSNNPIIKSFNIGNMEKETIENSNNIYKKLWNEGFLRYEEICKNKTENKNKEKNECLNNDIYWKLNFGMANELFEISIKKDEFMFDVKNKFLNDFFEKKMYGNNEKKYITDNILFLNKEGIIDIEKKVNENNINNNEIIIPVLKDVT